jgi:mannose/fructose/N-acetylgalactosamine-specific phosphotransferase system component IID
MAARTSRGSQRNRGEVERARLYAARKAWHQNLQRRRVRDTVVACIIGGLIVVGALVSQTVHAQVTAPAPTLSHPPASPAATTTAVPSPDPTQTPGE